MQSGEAERELKKLYSEIEELLKSNLDDTPPAFIFNPQKL